MDKSLRRRAVFVVAVVLASSAPLHARPAHKQALADYFGPFLAKPLNDCRTCHLPDMPNNSSAALPSEKPHNAFGARLKAVKSELRQAGKKTTIADRLEAIADEDSDGDGVANFLEILSGHFPGDAKDKPSAAELAEAQKTLLAFRKWKQGYRWAPFEKVQRPPLPAVKKPAWMRNPIDFFIAAEHEARGLQPRPEANRSTLLRRVYLDLIGLPPTPDQLHAFLADNDSDALEKVVDQLLASPQYGERWGRHWMDIWRYSDWAGWSDGGQIRDSQPHIWRWRDWIVESLNRDTGYERMILEMLAADELAPEDPDALRATGYLVRNYKMLSREKWMQDTVDHTFLAFQGVTIGCARCHDHMYDPLLQKEYYQVRAIFEPHKVRIDRIPGQPDPKQDGLVRVYDAEPQVPTYLYIRGDDRTPEKTPLPPSVPEALGGGLLTPALVRLPIPAFAPDKRAFVIAEELAASEARLATARTQPERYRLAAQKVAVSLLNDSPLQVIATLVHGQKDLLTSNLADTEVELAAKQHQVLTMVIQLEKLEDKGQRDTPAWKGLATETVKAQRQAAVAQAHRDLVAAHRAKWNNPAAELRGQVAKNILEAEKALPKAVADLKLPATIAYTPRASASYPEISTGRRLAFARWLANRSNPLTARVAMNHVWLRHFGKAIVPSVFDFGRNGRPPSHPALLDWLAAEFMERGWSMKAMHRLMVTSATYRLSSTTDLANVALDRDDEFLWRMPSRRVEAEVVRDCIFYIGGKLDLSMGGPDIDYNQGLTVPRRSIYFRHAAEKEMEFLKLFDCAAVTECYQRKESIMPQQALALANSEVTLVHARLLARHLATQSGSDPTAFIQAAFEHVLARTPTKQELDECAGFLNQQAQRYNLAGSQPPQRAPADGRSPAREPMLRARESLIHVLMNHNDFVTVR